jgi:hypothetical protein
MAVEADEVKPICGLQEASQVQSMVHSSMAAHLILGNSW